MRAIRTPRSSARPSVLAALWIAVGVLARVLESRWRRIAGSVLGVGIGFGLQNLANNFVSGLVISLERPIKPGDYVRSASSKGRSSGSARAAPRS